MASTTEYFSFNAVEYCAPVGACELARSSSGNPLLNLPCPGFFDIGFRFFQTLQQLGSHFGPLIERQFQCFCEKFTSSACHAPMLARGDRDTDRGASGGRPAGGRLPAQLWLAQPQPTLSLVMKVA